MAIYRHITNPECRQYLLRQAYEEAVHTDTFIYCCDTLGLQPDDIYTMYQTIPSIKEKDDFVVEMTKSVFDPGFETKTPEQIQRFVHDLVGYYVIMEGIFFYAGFAMMLSMLRRHKMVGIGEQFQFILRDETVHLAFGSELINTIAVENPEICQPKLSRLTSPRRLSTVSNSKSAMRIKAPPKGIVGLTPQSISEYLEHIADRRLERINLKPVSRYQEPIPMDGAGDHSTPAKKRTSLRHASTSTRPEDSWSGRISS